MLSVKKQIMGMLPGNDFSICWFAICIPVFLSVCLSVCLSLCLCQSACLSVHVSAVCLSACPSIVCLSRSYIPAHKTNLWKSLVCLYVSRFAMFVCLACLIVCDSAKQISDKVKFVGTSVGLQYECKLVSLSECRSSYLSV